jgi:capsular polysaccharide biosynthesis protein
VSFAHGKPSFSYRGSEIWAGQETLLITERGFPEGRTVFPVLGSGSTGTPQYADPSRLADLADFYARLANSDVVLERIPGTHVQIRRPLVTAAPVVSAANQAPLPLLSFTGEAQTPNGALRLTHAAVNAFRSYMADKQNGANIPTDQRVVLSVVDDAAKAVVVQPRKKTTPLLVFVAIVAATLVFTLILEHMRPRIRVVEEAVRPRELGAQRAAQPQSAVGVGRADANR